MFFTRAINILDFFFWGGGWSVDQIMVSVNFLNYDCNVVFESPSII
jgi:hypothetical protein